MYSPCSSNINVEWKTLKNTLLKAANESVGKRQKRRNKRLLILWNKDIKNLIENKKKVYLQNLTTRSENNRIEYKRLVAISEKRNKKN